MPRILRASFYKRSGLAGLQQITVRHKFSNHSVTFLDYRIGDRKNYFLPPENTPVQYVAGEGPTKARTGYGYVNHYETVADADGAALTRMVVIGTSKPMNSVNTSSWQGQTRSAIVRDIARRHRLRSVVHSHPYVLDNWTTGTRTDFAALQALAVETGYRLWVDGGTVWFLDPEKILRSASNMTVPRIRQGDQRDTQVLGGSSIPGEMASSTRRIQYGLDYRTNEFFTATSGDPLHPTQVSSDTVTTFAEGQDSANAANRTQRDYFVLKANIEGNANIVPGSLISMEAGRVNTDQSGLWMVGEVSHAVTTEDFSTRLVANRGVDQFPLTRVPSTVRGASGVTPVVIRNGLTWEAALQEHLSV